MRSWGVVSAISSPRCDTISAVKRPGGQHQDDRAVRPPSDLPQPSVGQQPCHRVNSSRVSMIDFDISKQETEAFFAKAYAAAEDFLSTWDWHAYLRQLR
jgi:hypothetical protein